MTRTRLAVIATVGISVAAGAISYWYWTRTPTYSLHQVQAAFKTHDVAKFEKHVDISSVASRLIDDILDHTIEDTQGEDETESFGSTLATGLVQLMKPRFVEAIREQAVRLVEQGDFGGSSSRTDETESGDVSLEGLSEEFGANEESIKGITYVKKQGKIALVGLVFRNTELASDLTLELKMRDMGGYWQVAELSNVSSLLKEIKRLETARLAELNEPVRQQISRTLQVENAKKTNRSDRWGISKSVNIRISVRNISTRAVTGFSATVRLLDPNRKLVKEIRIRDEEPIEPFRTGGGTWSTRVSMFDASNKRLYDLKSEDVRFEIAFTRVVFRDGTELKLFESLKESSQRQNRASGM